MKTLSTIAGVAAFIAALGYAGTHDFQEAEQADALYTEMVCLGRATDMNAGWPNYKNLHIKCGE